MRRATPALDHMRRLAHEFQGNGEDVRRSPLLEGEPGSDRRISADCWSPIRYPSTWSHTLCHPSALAQLVCIRVMLRRTAAFFLDKPWMREIRLNRERIEDTSRIVRSHHSFHLDLARFYIHGDLDKLCAKGADFVFTGVQKARTGADRLLP